MAKIRRTMVAAFSSTIDGDLGRVTPIGLSIGAKTPAEIAVSIAAQVIQVRSALTKK